MYIQLMSSFVLAREGYYPSSLLTKREQKEEQQLPLTLGKVKYNGASAKAAPH